MNIMHLECTLDSDSSSSYDLESSCNVLQSNKDKTNINNTMKKNLEACKSIANDIENTTNLRNCDGLEKSLSFCCNVKETLSDAQKFEKKYEELEDENKKTYELYESIKTLKKDMSVEEIEKATREKQSLCQEIEAAKYIGDKALRHYKENLNLEVQFEQKEDSCVMVVKFDETAKKSVRIVLNENADKVIDFSLSESTLSEEQIQILKQHFQETNNFTSIFCVLRNIM